MIHDWVLHFSQDDDIITERKKVLTGATSEEDVVIIKDIFKVCCTADIYGNV